MADKDKILKPPFDLRTLFAESHGGEDRAQADAHRMDDDISERCRRMSEEVQWETLKPFHNIMRPCRGELQIPYCRDIDLPDIRPRFYVFWGDSVCDCIEGDDTETMIILVYNPYRNISLCNVEINRMRVVDSAGNNVPLLPDGSEAVQLVPRGGYCFGDLRPCGFAFRQFSLRLRGVPAGSYRILIEGICFELCLNRMTEDCVTFDVCKD